MDVFDKEYDAMRDRIFALLKEQKISQRAFAQKIQVSPQTITDWKKGKSHSFSSMLDVISTALHTTPSFLFSGNGLKYLSDEQREELIKQELDVLERTRAEMDRLNDEENQELIASFRQMMISKGYSPFDFTRESVKLLAENLGTTTEYLLTGVDPEAKKAPASAGKWIPVLGDVAAGVPIEAIVDIVDYEEIDAALAATGDFFGLRIKGSSMEPRMQEGDVVIVRKQDDAETGEIAVVTVNGDSATVKKIKKLPDGLQLIPTNPAHDPLYYTAAEVEYLPVRIIGRVVELRAKF